MTVPSGQFEFVPHTADIAVRLRADSLPSLFEAAAAAFTEALTDHQAVRAIHSRVVTVDASDADLLLVDWLHELLFLFETERFLVSKAEVSLEEGAPLRLQATVRGERWDEARHHLKVLIKAVTYHGLDIVRREEAYHATIIFDI